MSDIDPIQFSRVSSQQQEKQHQSKAKIAGPVVFNRQEIDQILTIYCRQVASGDWRDYAIDMLRDKAVFSIFRRSCETPLYRIEKNPKLARRQGQYSVIAATGLILKRGHDLRTVLRVLEKKPKLVEI